MRLYLRRILKWTFVLAISVFITSVFIREVYRVGGTWNPAKYNVFFLKTHKTGSCTVQNVLYRFGDNRGLAFAIGEKGLNFEYPKKLHRSSVLPVDLTKTATGGYNILCNHARFDLREASAIMPRDTVFITILRDPATAFVSRIAYEEEIYRPCFDLVADDIGGEFARNVARYYPVRSTRPMCAPSSPSHNQNAFDFGLEMSDMDNTDVVIEKVREIDRVFSLVMIMEYFDESMILLRHLLNWSLDDIVYLRHNVFKKPKYSKALSASQLEKLREWNSADYAIYNYFNKTFWNTLETFGRARLRTEVEELRDMNAKWRRKCVRGQADGNAAELEESNLPWHPKSMGYVLKEDAKTSKMCRDLTRAEIQYSNLIRNRMIEISLFSDSDYGG